VNINLPNLLSTIRILLVPLLVVVLLTKFENKEVVGLAVFLLAALTDFLDGFLARRNQQVTRLGKLLDPAADKILTSAAFISLVELGLAPAWMVAAIVGREFAVSTLRSMAAADRLVIAASASAKLKTISQIVTIAVLIASPRLYFLPPWVGPACLWVALVLTLYSGAEYLVRYAPAIIRGERPPGL